jgi:hypothetical protein
MKIWKNLGQSILIKYKHLFFIYEMNTTQNKAALWKSCVEQGIFEKIPSSYQHQIQGLFELTIRQFNNDGLDLATANQMFLRDFKVELMKLTNVQIPSKTFEETNSEYNKLFQPEKPEKIDFNKEMDTPLKDIERLLKEKADQRLLESQNYFKDTRVETIETDKTESNEPNVNSNELKVNESKSDFTEKIQTNQMFTFPKEQDKTEELIKMMKQQQKILSGILESQIKIIDLLQKKMK